MTGILDPRLVPTVPVEIDWGHPLAQGLVACYIPGRADDLCGIGTAIAPTYTNSQIGPAFAQGGGSQVAVPARWVIGSTVSVFGVIETFTTNNYLGSIGLVETTTAYNAFYSLALNGYGDINFSYNNGTSGIPGEGNLGIGWASSPFNTPGMHGSLCGTIRYGGNAELYVNGVVAATQAAPTGPAYTGATAAASAGTALQYWSCGIVAWWNRELTPNEVAWMHAEPFAMLRPSRPVRYYAAATPAAVTARQYAAPGAQGLVYVNEASAGKQYGLPLGGYLSDTSVVTGLSAAPAAGAILFTGFAPNVSAQSFPSTGALSFTGFAPTLPTLTATPAAGAIHFTGFAPSPDSLVSPPPPAGALLFTGFAPSPDSLVSPPPPSGAIVFTGFAPAPVAVSPNPGMFSIIL